MKRMVLCPECRDKKESVARFKCFRCDGKKEIPEAMVGWIKKGRMIRGSRLRLNKSGAKLAREFGLSPIELDCAETGRINPVDVMIRLGMVEFRG